jgi:Tfp pilus assembly protein PilX
MNKIIRYRNRHRQRGVAALLVSVVLLLAMTVIIIYSSRSSLLELQLMASAHRMRQAVEAADAGLDWALSTYLRGSGTAVPSTQTGTVGTAAWQVQYCTPASTLTTCSTATNGNSMRMVATGWSDDRTAVHRASMLVTGRNVFEAVPKAPLIAKGALGASLTGNLNIVNNSDFGLTIWTGTPITTTTGSFTTRVKINGQVNQISSSKVGSTFNLGPDVIQNDYSLAATTAADYVESVLGTSVDSLISMADFEAASITDIPGPEASNNYHANKVIYINGNVVLNNSLFPTSTRQFGTVTTPAILVINGNIDIRSSFDFYGIIIANNVVGATGTSVITGSVITNSVNNVSGNLTIQADPNLETKRQSFVKRTTVSTSWRDW